MTGTRILSFDQEKFLLHIYKKIEKEIKSGSTHVLFWELSDELSLINRVLSNRSYSMHGDDVNRLNSLRNLYEYVKHR
jgi:hypothetical protein